LTNFATVRKSLKKMSSLERMMKEDTYKHLAKKERLMKHREREKLERVLGGISDLTRLPAALFIVDIVKEHIAVAEAKKLRIPIFAVVDTNADPDVVDFAIPANDDAYKSIALVVKAVSRAMEEGLTERKRDKDDEQSREAEIEQAREAAEAVAQKKAIDTGKTVEVDAVSAGQEAAGKVKESPVAEAPTALESAGDEADKQ
ncbi:MAG: 30S ribosomal protein S2, partial [Catalinimonas sp.]